MRESQNHSIPSDGQDVTKPDLIEALVVLDSISSLILHRHNIDPPLPYAERRQLDVAIGVLRDADYLRPQLATARRWAELEAAVAEGGRVVAETPCEHGDWGICDHIPTERRGCMRLDCKQYHPKPGCPGGSRRIILGEGAE